MTFKQLQEIDQMMGELYQTKPNLKESKLGYAYKRFSDKNYLPVVRNFQDELSIVRIENALEDPITKEILSDKTNVRGYKYSKAGLKECILAEKRIIDEWDTKELEIKPFYTKDIPEGLTEEQIILLKGVLFE